MQLHQPKTQTRIHKNAVGAALLLLGSALSTGCPPDSIAENADMGSLEDPALDPRGLFETTVKPDIVGTCSCHVTMIQTISPFLASGDEYNSITNYQSGKFLTMNVDISPLLTKGMHEGPPLSSDLAGKVKIWLQAESVARGSMGSPTTPTVAIRLGNFFISLQTLVGDPLAKITFNLDAFGTGSYRVSNLQLTAGPTADIHIKHPRFIIFSAAGATADASDALSGVDQTIPATMTATIGAGTVLLTGLPASSARLALAFQAIDKVNPNPNAMEACKNYAAFYPAVTNRLATCAGICHSPTGTDSRSSQANGAFNMSAAQGTDDTALKQLCLYALARLNLTNIPQSVLILQPEPATMGGTANHPYKLDTPAKDFPGFQTAVAGWANGEK